MPLPWRATLRLRFRLRFTLYARQRARARLFAVQDARCPPVFAMPPAATLLPRSRAQRGSSTRCARRGSLMDAAQEGVARCIHDMRRAMIVRYARMMSAKYAVGRQIEITSMISMITPDHIDRSMPMLREIDDARSPLSRLPFN